MNDGPVIDNRQTSRAQRDYHGQRRPDSARNEYTATIGNYNRSALSYRTPVIAGEHVRYRVHLLSGQSLNDPPFNHFEYFFLMKLKIRTT